MSPILSRLYKAPGGTEALDVLMKYMYVVTLTTVDIAQLEHLPLWVSAIVLLPSSTMTQPCTAPS
jgi:hypothetical protein